jgi:hypothetical protein
MATAQMVRQQQLQTVDTFAQLFPQDCVTGNSSQLAFASGFSLLCHRVGKLY